jgi:L-amino acid N-acyltransferase YncA
MEFVIGPMDGDDWPEVLAVYEEGIASHEGTFETSAPSWVEWSEAHLPECRLVARGEGILLGWAALSPVSRRQCYSGVAEVSIYVLGAARGRGIGTALLEELITESEACGFWTLQGARFPENDASLRLLARCGFREIGRRERIARLNGVWRDTVLAERRSQRVGWE